MIIRFGDQLINLNQTFSIKIGGQGMRYLMIKGPASLESEFVFPSKTDAQAALDAIKEGAAKNSRTLELSNEPGGKS